jgi:hypothetical protein
MQGKGTQAHMTRTDLLLMHTAILQCYPSIQSNAELAHVSAGTGFWTYVDWDFFAHLSEYYTPLKPVTLF